AASNGAGVIVSGVTLDGNLSATNSTGLSVSGAASIDLTDAILRNFGDGVMIDGGGDSIISRVQIENVSNHGVVLDSVGTVRVDSTTVEFAGSDAFVVEGTNPTDVVIVNCLAFGSGFGTAGNGVTVAVTDNVAITNTIIVSNAGGLDCDSAGCLADYNIVWGNFVNYRGSTAAGDNDLTVDPRFVAPNEADFRLLFDSPAIDAGSSAYAEATDLAGANRTQGDAVDIGPIEFTVESSTVAVAINEVMANPLNEGQGEFVELFNYGSDAVDVAGWVIDDGDARDVITGWDGGSTSIPAGRYGVILDPDYPGAIYTIPGNAVLLTIVSTSTLGSGLSNNDAVRIEEADGTTVDSYGFPFNAGNGVSVEKDTVEDGDALSNWVASPCGSTPGAENCASQPSNVTTQVRIAINEIMANPISETTGEFIELYNFGDTAIDVSGMRLSDGDANDVVAAWQGGSTMLEAGQYGVILDPDYASGYSFPLDALLLTIASTTTLGNGLANNDPISLLTANGLSVIDTYTHPFNAGNGRSVEKVDPGLIDLASNFVGSTCASGSSPGAPNCVTQDGVMPTVVADLFITEVMANPLDEDTGEYIEIFNFGDDAVDLADFRLSDGDKEEKLQAFGGGTTVLPSLGYALIVDSEYAGQYTIGAGAILLTTTDTTICSGLSTNDPITVRAPTGAAVLASASFPFNPGNGISAERIDVFVGDVPQNWVASPCNGSPGANNCASDDGGGPTGAPVSTTSIVISEVMANPLVERTGEYIELFNAGPVGVDLGAWQISDGDSFDSLQPWTGANTILGPGEFAVILDPDYANDYVVGAGTLRLKTATATIGNGLTPDDAITLYEADGVTVVDRFSFPYNPGNGKAVEKVTMTAGDRQENWVTSTCLKSEGDTNDFASPGRRNCVDPYGGISGTNALGQSCPFGASDCFSGLCALEIQTLGTFCTDDCSVDACANGFTCTDITDVNYPQVCVPVGGGSAPEVRINEILYDVDGADTEVFVELYGTPDTILDGLTLNGVNGTNGQDYVSVTLSGQIPADGYFVIAHTSATGATAANADLMTTKVDFQNGPDSVQLRQGELVLDAVGYGSFSAAIFAGEGTAIAEPPVGQSLARVPDTQDTDDNSADFEAATPTPGAAN
ncbi:MAG: hypothetical protein ACI9MR_002202, partial [Myxococcota bacterium]